MSRLLTKKEVYRCFRKILADCRRRNCELDNLLLDINRKPNSHTEKLNSCITKLQSAYGIRDISSYGTVYNLMNHIVSSNKFKDKNSENSILCKAEMTKSTNTYYLIYNESGTKSGRFDTFAISKGNVYEF